MTDANAAAALAPITIRRNADIYETDGGWFHARWHFSFDQYRDPENTNVGLLRVFNHDTLRPGAVWPMHPHRDIEGITYVVAGEFEHADSLGNGGVLLPGGVQRMTLGYGADHSERNHSQTDSMQFIQMWILPARQGLTPSVEQQQFSDADRHNRLLRILKPEAADGEGVMVHQDASIFVSKLDAGASLSHHFAADRRGYLHLISGALTVNAATLTAGDAAKIIDSGALDIAASAASELLLVDVPAS